MKKKSETDPIKSCPFCGGRPVISTWTEAFIQGHNGAVYIECPSDLADCPVNPRVTGYEYAEAKAAWNMRAGGE